MGILNPGASKAVPCLQDAFRTTEQVTAASFPLILFVFAPQPAQSLEADQWPDLVAQFSAQIRNNSDPVRHETILRDF